ncbi:MAG: hypothetical protein J5I90_14780 [Caldilineales bacterium]|nr:hypothetical protein [Caldilineales bacterium]
MLPDFSEIFLILHHDDPDGGLAALALRRAIQRQTGRVLPLARADYHSRSANNLHELVVLDPHIYTVDTRLFPGVPGMDHHDSSQQWFDPAIHILDLKAQSCFSLMLDTAGGREDWSDEVVQFVDWMDSGQYPSAELAVGLDSLGQQFLAVYTGLEHEQALIELWRESDAEAFVARHRGMIDSARDLNKRLRTDMARKGWRQGRVAVWDSSPIIESGEANPRAINPFLLCAVYPRADYTIRLKPDGHMTIGYNPWANPSAHIGQLCESLQDPTTGQRGGGKRQVGGAPASPDNLAQALAFLNEN